MPRFILLVALCATALARPDYRRRLPNPDNTDVCPQLGHEDCQPVGFAVNQLGADFLAAGSQYTVEFCQKDSDGDGVSNGAELGDPCCVWSEGDTAARTADISNPGDPNSTPQPGTDITCKTATSLPVPSSDTNAPAISPPSSKSPSSSPDPTSAPSSSADPSPAPSYSTAPSSTPTTSAVPSLEITISAAPSSEPTTTPTPSPIANTPAISESTPSTESPSVTEDSSEPVCFPANAIVLLMDGTIKTMETLSIGDKVQVADGSYSEVFMFTHRLSDVMHSMVALTTTSGATIELTAGHHLYVNGRLDRAGNVELGNMLQLADGSSIRVIDVKWLQKRGLYNPQTRHGDIVVGGIKASTYTDAVNACAAHAALAPLRALYSWLALYSAALESGIEAYVSAATDVNNT